MPLLHTGLNSPPDSYPTIEHPVVTEIANFSFRIHSSSVPFSRRPWHSWQNCSPQLVFSHSIHRNKAEKKKKGKEEHPLFQLPAELVNSKNTSYSSWNSGWEPQPDSWTIFDRAKSTVRVEWSITRTPTMSWSHLLVLTAGEPLELVFWDITTHVI